MAVVVFLVSTISFAQNYSNESYLIEYLGQSRFDQLSASNSQYLNFLDARCSFGFDVIDYFDEEEKMVDFVTLNEFPKKTETKNVLNVSAADFLSEIESGNFNFIMYLLQWDRKSITYYIIGDTGKILLIYPVNYINDKVNSK